MEEETNKTAGQKKPLEENGPKEQNAGENNGNIPEIESGMKMESDKGSVHPGSGSGSQRGKPRRRGRGANSSNRKKITADKNSSNDLKSEGLKDPVDDKNEKSKPPDKPKESSATEGDNLQNKEEQVKPKVGRVIKKPKMLAQDYELSSTKKVIGRGRRSLAEANAGNSDTDTSGDTSIRRRNDVNPKWLVPFQHGWRREVVLRNTYGEKASRPADVYYYSPHGGPKLRSIPEICRHLRETNSKVTTDCFTFIKELIYNEPDEMVRYAGKGWSNKTKAGSPVKLAVKIPTAKQKKLFHKSPLSKKRSSAASSKAKDGETLPELKSEPNSTSVQSEGDVNVSTPCDGVSEVDAKPSDQTVVHTVGDQSSVTMPTLSSENGKHTEVKQVSSLKSNVKQAVAKKHTAKRLHGAVESNNTENVGTTTKKYKTGGKQRLCGMDCPGRHGVPPSLHCNVCMCMFHPECIGKQGLQRFDGFVCKSCKLMNKKLRDMPNVSVPLPAPPPLQASPSPNTNLTCGPPPLRAAPTVGGIDGLRGPPPLRMAPISSLPPVAPSPVALSVRLPTMQLPQVMPADMGCSQPINMLAPVTLSTALSTPNVAPVPSDMVLNMATPQPASNPVPSVVPKDISGQVLALPKGISEKLDLGKPVSLRLNGQDLVIPPNCFMNTEDGAKVYLPDDYLPGNMTEGPDHPLSITLSENSEKNGQVIGISAYKDKDSANVEKDGTQIRKRQGHTKPNDVSHCFIQSLHVGFDCMLQIFQFLGLVDLLRASQVCKTWKRVATQSCLWKKVRLHGCKILDWKKAATKLKEMHTQILDMQGMLHSKDSSSTWKQFVSVLSQFIYLQHIIFGQCPGAVLHAVAEKLSHLEGLTAEFIVDTQEEPEKWVTCVALDIGKFAHLKQLQLLKLRGICGLQMPSFSFSGGLAEFSSLTQLKVLSLTTLRGVPEHEFSFVGSLTELEELELGEIQHWTSETYKQLANLRKLRSLRLEYGKDYEDDGLGEALSSMENLTNLELIKFTVSGSLVRNLPKLKSIRSLSIWPDIEEQVAIVNTRTLQAVSNMKSLAQLNWGIMVDYSREVNPDNPQEVREDQSEDGKDESIPLYPANLSMQDEDILQTDGTPEYLTISELVDRLSNFLPDTKIRVFKVPIITVSRDS